MTTRILITGMNSFDSGKTTFAIQLMKRFLNDGYRLEYFKPISGHNYWYHYLHTTKCLNLGQLFSFDADKVRQQFSSSIPILITNPVHTLYAPAKTERPSQSYIPTTLGLAGWDSILVAKRFSQPIENGVQSVMLVAKSLLMDDSLIVTQEEIDRLSSNADIIPVTALEEVQAFEQQCLESMIGASFDLVENSSDIVFIESFNDSAWPWERLEYVDKVFAIGPGHLFQYDSERFRKAVFMVHKDTHPIREVSLNRVDDILKPISRVQLIPSKGLPESLNQLDIE